MNKKKKIIILSTPAYGHINPILAIAAELVRREHAVLFYATDEFRKIIEATGSTFISYKNSKFKYVDSHEMKNAFMLANYIIDATWDVIKQKPFTEEDKPDILIHDSLALWGKVLAHMYSIPAVCICVGMIVNPRILLRYPQMNLKIIVNSLLHTYRVQKRYKHLLKTVGIQFKELNDVFINEEKRTLVFTTRLFQPYADKFGDNISFIGPSLLLHKRDNDIASFLKGKKHIVYISLGTINNDDVHFFRTCIEVFKYTDCTVIISLGKQLSLNDLPLLPDNFFVREYWPQLAILEKAELFITHGGMNSIMESAYYAVPMIVVPQSTEQRICALRLHQLGGGIFIDKKKLTNEKLIDAVNKIKTDSSYVQQMKVLQKSVNEAGGYKKAADEILLNSN